MESQVHSLEATVVKYKDAEYRGMCKDGKPYGYGVMKAGAGEQTFVYTGEFGNGVSHGRGRFAAPNGDVFEGQFQENKRHGRGVTTKNDGTQFIDEYDLGTLRKRTKRKAPASWEQVTTTGVSLQARHGHTVVAASGGLFLFGGYDFKTYFNDVLVFNPDGNVWTSPAVSGTPPSPRMGHSATLIADHFIFVFGGRNLSDYLNDLYILDTERGVWSRPQVRGTLPEPRHFHAAAEADGNLYIFGGVGPEFPRWRNDVWALHTESMTWRRLGVCDFSPRCGLSAVNVGSSRIICYGGTCGKMHLQDRNGSRCFADISTYDTTRCTWHETPSHGDGPAPLKRCHHSACASGSRLIVFGGHYVSPDELFFERWLNDIYVLNAETGTWTMPLLGNLPPMRTGQACAVLGDYFYVIAGRHFDLLNDVWRISISRMVGLVNRAPNAATPVVAPPDSPPRERPPPPAEMSPHPAAYLQHEAPPPPARAAVRQPSPPPVFAPPRQPSPPPIFAPPVSHIHVTDAHPSADPFAVKSEKPTLRGKWAAKAKSSGGAP